MEKKNFVTSLVTVLLKMTLCLWLYFVLTKKTMILSLFKIDTLNFMYILTILISPLKIYVIGLQSNFTEHFLQHKISSM